MIRRIDQQIRVNRMMMEALDLEGVENVRQRNYLFHYLEIVTTVSSILLLKAGDGESLEKMRELWAFLQDQDAVVYRKLRRGLFGRMLHLPGRAGRAVPVAAYRLTQKIFGFN